MALMQLLLWVPALAAGFLAFQKYSVWRTTGSHHDRQSFTNTLALMSITLVVLSFTWTMMLQPQLTWAQYHVSELP